MSAGVEAWIGLGANLGDPEAQLRAAFRAIDALPGTRLLQQSSLYRTAAIGGPEQADYLNAVAQVCTELSPRALLAALLEIERRAGRVRNGEINAPRMLDLDLLQHAGATSEYDADLVLPHPRLHLRAFVLVPLIELGACFEIAGRSLHDWLKQASTQRVLRLQTL